MPHPRTLAIAANSPSTRQSSGFSNHFDRSSFILASVIGMISLMRFRNDDGTIPCSAVRRTRDCAKIVFGLTSDVDSSKRSSSLVGRLVFPIVSYQETFCNQIGDPSGVSLDDECIACISRSIVPKSYRRLLSTASGLFARCYSADKSSRLANPSSVANSWHSHCAQRRSNGECGEENLPIRTDLRKRCFCGLPAMCRDELRVPLRHPNGAS